MIGVSYFDAAASSKGILIRALAKGLWSDYLNKSQVYGRGLKKRQYEPNGDAEENIGLNSSPHFEDPFLPHCWKSLA